MRGLPRNWTVPRTCRPLVSRSLLASKNRRQEFYLTRFRCKAAVSASLPDNLLKQERDERLKILKKQVASLKEALAIIEVAIKDAESGVKEISPLPEIEASSLTQPRVSASGKIIACLGKDCRKQGALQTYNQLQEEIRARPEMGNIKLQTCKCLKECGKGPVIGVKLGKQKIHIHKRAKSKNLERVLSKELNTYNEC